MSENLQKMLGVIAMAVLVVVGVSASSYSDEADNNVRNAALLSPGLPDGLRSPGLPDGCDPERYMLAGVSPYTWADYECLTEAEQYRYKSLLWSVSVLAGPPPEGDYDHDSRDFLELLVTFDALELLCYQGIDIPGWPMTVHMVSSNIGSSLLTAWLNVELVFRRKDVVVTDTAMVTKSFAEPIFEPVRYRHLCSPLVQRLIEDRVAALDTSAE